MEKTPCMLLLVFCLHFFIVVADFNTLQLFLSFLLHSMCARSWFSTFLCFMSTQLFFLLKMTHFNLAWILHLIYSDEVWPLETLILFTYVNFLCLNLQDVQAINIVLDPGLAFGTGEHPSTQLCLLLLQSLIKGGEYFLDYGTGSGILAIAALKVFRSLLSICSKTFDFCWCGEPLTWNSYQLMKLNQASDTTCLLFFIG